MRQAHRGNVASFRSILAGIRTLRTILTETCWLRIGYHLVVNRGPHGRAGKEKR